MKPRERVYFLLAAGMSLGVHATAAVYFGDLSLTQDGLNTPPAQIVRLSLVTERAATPPSLPAAPPEAAPARIAPTPRPLPQHPAQVQPERALPKPEPETVAASPAATAAPAMAEIAAPQQPATTASAAARESYLARLLAHIDSHKFYPRGARQRGQEGDVHVKFYLLQDGGIRALEISGGSRLLRTAAERAVQAALPLPQPPESVNLGEQVSFSMQFRLKG